MTLAKTQMTRRAALLAATATAVLAATPGVALTTPEAQKLVGQVVAEINRVINSGKSERAMIADFERIFRTYGDVPTIARSALGPPARQASQGQLAAFSEAFSGYIARKYGKRFREFIGGQIVTQGARPAGRYFEVPSVVNLKGQAPFRVSFMVSDRNRFFDMVIEGISLLKTERVEIGALLDQRRGNLDRLITDLKKLG